MRQLYILLFTLISVDARAQNAVPNASFEQFLNCEPFYTQIEHSKYFSFLKFQVILLSIEAYSFLFSSFFCINYNGIIV